jgi:hypothetical protein
VIAFSNETPTDQGADQWRAPYLATVEVGSVGTRISSLRNPGPRLPNPASIGESTSYMLQLEPDGRASFFIDGRLYSRSQVAPPPERLHVAIGGASINAEVAHGRVRVFEGLRYKLPE